MAAVTGSLRPFARAVKRATDDLLFPIVHSVSAAAAHPHRVLGGAPVHYELNGEPLGLAMPEALLIDGASVWPEVGVAQRRGSVIRETTVDPRLLTAYEQTQRLRRYPVAPIPGVVACLNVGSSHKGFFHRWVEALPRAWALAQLTEPLDRSVNLLMTNSIQPEFAEFLRRMAPAGSTVTRVPRFLRLRPTGGYLHLPVPYRSYFPPGSDTPVMTLPAAYVERFQAVADEMFGGRDSQPAKVFVSRRKAAGRRLLNDDEVADFLRKRGYAIVILEDLSISDQARIFRGAETVVAQHGAALTNLLYCRPGTRVLEIFNSARTGAEEMYGRLSSLLQLQHTVLAIGGLSKDANVVLPLDQLSEALTSLERGVS